MNGTPLADHPDNRVYMQNSPFGEYNLRLVAGMHKLECAGHASQAVARPSKDYRKGRLHVPMSVHCREGTSMTQLTI